MNNLNKLDFTGQNIYVGIDVHKKSWSVSIFTEHLEHKTFTQPPEVNTLVNYLRRNFPGASYKSVYEAGYSGFWIHDALKEQGVNCIVVNPADVPTKHKETAGKTNKVDCRKLARGLRSNELEGIYVPPRSHIEERNLIRTRQSMVRKQTRCKNQIKAILGFYGIHIPDELSMSHWSKRFINWLKEIRMVSASGDLTLKAHLDELISIRNIIAELTRNIRRLSETEKYRTNVRLLKTVPGISTLTAMILLTELHDISRFKTFDKLLSYVGLIPNTDSSGEKDNKTAMTNRHNSLLRPILIECSWIAVRKDPVLTMKFNELIKRTTKTNAIVTIAKKLLNRIRYVLKNQKEYVTGVIE